MLCKDLLSNKYSHFSNKELLLDKLGLNWGMWTDPDYDYTYMRRKTDA